MSQLLDRYTKDQMRGFGELPEVVVHTLFINGMRASFQNELDVAGFRSKFTIHDIV